MSQTTLGWRSRRMDSTNFHLHGVVSVLGAIQTQTLFQAQELTVSINLPD